MPTPMETELTLSFKYALYVQYSGFPLGYRPLAFFRKKKRKTDDWMELKEALNVPFYDFALSVFKVKRQRGTPNRSGNTFAKYKGFLRTFLVISFAVNRGDLQKFRKDAIVGLAWFSAGYREGGVLGAFEDLPTQIYHDVNSLLLSYGVKSLPYDLDNVQNIL